MDKDKLLRTRRYLRSSLNWLREIKKETVSYDIALDEAIRHTNMSIDFVTEIINTLEIKEELDD